MYGVYVCVCGVLSSKSDRESEQDSRKIENGTFHNSLSPVLRVKGPKLVFRETGS